MILHLIMRRIQRRYGGMYVQVVWTEVLGDPEWVVSTHVFGYPHPQVRSRSRFLLMALWRAYRQVPPTIVFSPVMRGYDGTHKVDT
jgi:hypothetical protein